VKDDVEQCGMIWWPLDFQVKKKKLGGDQVIPYNLSSNIFLKMFK
jgi:hypothetical protein